ncbi:hypothetical protein BGX24_007727, partial [Mortierella sp. AD032]
TLPYCIKHYPGVVLDVVLSAVEYAHVDSLMAASSASGQVGTTTGTTTANCLADALPTYAPADTPTNAPTDHPIEDNTVEILQMTSPPAGRHFSDIKVSGLSTTFSLSLSKAFASVDLAPKTAAFQKIVKKAQAFQAEQRSISFLDPIIQERIRAALNAYNLSVEALNSGWMEEYERLKKDFDGHFQELKAVMAKNADPAAYAVELLLTMMGKQDTFIANQDELNAKQEEIQQLQIAARKALEAKQEELNAKQDEIKVLQIQALGRLAVLHTRIKAVLTQTYELHEYPIPRLFVVLPQNPSEWDKTKLFSNKFRLYFLCECGEHTRSINSKAKIHHIHIAKHDGYEIARPTEFFQRYGPYVLTILKLLKFSISVAGVAVPAISQLVRADVIDQASTHLQKLQADIEPGMDKVIALMDGVSVDEGAAIEGFDGDMENKMALEGADLRQLDTFLKDKDGNKVLGNMFRTVTDEGHVKWVCIDHYRENYQESTAKEFQRVLDSMEGTVDEHLGRVEVKLRSRALADNFWAVLGKARSIHELDVDLDWACNMSDLEALKDALEKSRISILRLDIKKFPLSLGNTPSYASADLAVNRIMELSNMKMIHIILPTEFAKLSRLQSTHLHELSFEMVVGKSDGMEYRILAKKLKASSTLTAWCLYFNSVGDNGLQALFEALKTNSTQTTWDLKRNSIGDNEAKALAEALKTNVTLTTLDLNSNKIGSDGANALAEALKTNSTLTTLKLHGNNIGDKGAQALAEAVRTNLSLATLNLNYNNVGVDGAKALAEALKTNSTLTTLELYGNNIGDIGAQALAEAVKTNLTLTTLNLNYNNVGVDGAKALAAALKTNSTLITFNLSSNPIGDNGAQALAEALKTNSTLTTLNLWLNSIGDNGAQALAEALRTNSTLANLTLWFNSIGDDGVQALAEALKTNSTMTTLNLSSKSPSLAAVAAASTSTARKMTKVKVLLVDDNIINQKLLSRILSHFGVKHDTSNNGLEAVELIEKKTALLRLQEEERGGEESSPEKSSDVSSSLPMPLRHQSLESSSIAGGGTSGDMLDSSNVIGSEISFEGGGIPAQLPTMSGLEMMAPMTYAAELLPLPTMTRIMSSGGVHRTLRTKHVVPYDLIFLDILMPKMNGLDASAYIRKNLSGGTLDRPYINAMMVAVKPGDWENCIAAGMNGYLNKPFRVANVMQNTGSLLVPSAPDNSANSEISKRQS